MDDFDRDENASDLALAEPPDEETVAAEPADDEPPESDLPPKTGVKRTGVKRKEAAKPAASAGGPAAPVTAGPRNLYGLLDAPALIVSLCLHALLLIALALIHLQGPPEDEDLLIQTVIEQERPQQDFTRQLEPEMEAAQTLNIVSGGSVTDAATATSGATAGAVQAEVQESKTLETPTPDVRIDPTAPPRNIQVASAVGPGLVRGETAAVVDGYGAALSRLTQEIIGVMRTEKVMLVWMLDESHSMKDDREELSGKIDKVFDELGVAKEQDKRLRRSEEILMSAVIGYGRDVHELTKRPTEDLDELRKLIKDGVPIDETGDENMCRAIAQVCEKYGKMARAQDRKCMVVVVSDESGDDGQYVEDALAVALKYKSRIYVLGRESVFGHRRARIRVPDPDPQFEGLVHWLPIRRGPETAYVECLQWNGLHERRDSYSAGFGPYEMVRLCKESGGVFFVLPGEEEDLVGPGAREKRKYDFLDMKQYEPKLLSRPDYEKTVVDDTFRKTIYSVILALDPDHETNPLLPGNPKKPKGVLQIYDHWYPIEVVPFRQRAAKDVQKAVYAMGTLNRAIAVLDEIEPLRAEEASPRWRANYDLIRAQCVNYKVRLFQSLLAMDEHANNMPELKNAKSNRWGFHRSQRVIKPSEAQFERLKEAFNLEIEREAFLELVDEWIRFAEDRYAHVIEQHPRTPWAKRASLELEWGFGMAFREHYHDPRYEVARTKRKVPLPKQ